MAHFEPASIIDFIVEEVPREWDPKKLAQLEAQKQQSDLFKDEKTIAEEFKVVRKLPYKFSYKFKDTSGRTPKLMIEDWEIGALYWNCLKRAGGDESVAVEKVREKYWDQFVRREKYDLTLVLGTMLDRHPQDAAHHGGEWLTAAGI